MLDITQSKVLDKFCKIVEWTVFIGLCIASYFVTIGVWEQYKSYDSNFKRSKEPTSDGLTIMLNFWPGKNKDSGQDFDFGKDFNLSYSIISGKSEKYILERGINIIEYDDTKKIKVDYDEMKFPKRKESTLHKISSDFISKSEWAEVLVNFNKSILEENLPRVEIYITSERNSYGCNQWKYREGQELFLVGKIGKELWIKIQPENYVLLDKYQSPKSLCENNASFYESFDIFLIEEISKNCPMKCLPYSSINSSFPLCQTENGMICANDIFNEVKSNDLFLQKCTPSCVMTQYLATYEWSGNYNSQPGKNNELNRFGFYYIMINDDTIVFEEYLIQDLMSMIGSIGGTLGLFIGLSCSKLISIIINQLRNCLFHAIQCWVKNEKIVQ